MSAYDGLSPEEGDDFDGRSRRIRWLDVAALVGSDPPPVPWVVEPLVARGAVTMLAGAPGVGKSLFALAIASAVAGGASDLAGMAVTAGSVVIVDAENGKRTLHRRTHLVSLPAQGVLVGLAEGLDIRRHAREVREAVADAAPVLVVLDSLASLAPGLKENDADQTGEVTDQLRQLAQGADVAVLVLHHTRKAGDSYRGGTGIPAGVDVAAVYGRVEGYPERRVVDWSHDRGGKTRLGPEPDAQHLELGFVLGCLVIDAIDPPVLDRAAHPIVSEEAKRERRRHGLEKLLDGVLEFVTEHGPVSQNQVEEGVRGRAETIREALSGFCTVGTMVRTPRGYEVRPEAPDALGTHPGEAVGGGASQGGKTPIGVPPTGRTPSLAVNGTGQDQARRAGGADRPSARRAS